MRIDVLTLFPNMFTNPLGESIIGKAQEKDLLELHVHNFRDYSDNKHQTVDDYPYGGGAGMLLKVQPIYDNLKAIEAQTPDVKKRIILLDPAGKPFNQKMAEEFSKEEQLVFICGHYEGFDARITDNLVDEAISIGDYVLTGGEIPAMVVIDAVARMLNGVLGSGESAIGDSFYNGLLEYPQYTRPREFRGMPVPEILLSGDHAKIKKWRHNESLKKTFLNRPDLLEKTTLSADDKKYLATLKHRSE